MSWLIRKDQKGFTLIELLLALAILGVVTYFIVSLTSSVRHGGKVGETSQRMEIISAKMKEYYRAQGELPVPVGDDNNEVPVNELNLEAKFRFDGFGQVIYYHAGTEINDVSVDGVGNMAGYLWSLGGDQAINAVDGVPGDSGTDPLDPDNLADTAYSSGDDILTPINVNREAMEIALDEVRELQRRVNQFDNLFEGEHRCIYLTDNYTDETTYSPPDANIDACPPLLSNEDTSYPWENDPNCGTGSLDQIENAGAGTGVSNYGCENNEFGRDGDFTDAFTDTTDHAALKFIVGYYALGNNYLLDPWGNPYQWGCSSDTDDTGGTIASGICGSAPRFTTADKQYRKFFSLGPDGCTWTDNVTTSGEGFCADGTVPANNDDELENDDIIP